METDSFQPRDATVQSVLRAFALFDVLSNSLAPLSVTELSQALHYQVSTTFRLLQTLKRTGYVFQDPRTNRYSLGPKAVALQQADTQYAALRLLARPDLARLVELSRETANLVVKGQFAGIYIDQVTSLYTVDMFTRPGALAPFHCTGVGKVLLSGMEDQAIGPLLELVGMPRFTPYTITDLNRLCQELEQVRRSGIAYDMQERELGVACVACGIRGKTGQITAAISLSGPVNRVKGRLDKEFREWIVEAAETISINLGYLAPGKH